MKYYVVYIENSTARIKEFKTSKSATMFVNAFKTNFTTGNWVDYIIKGGIVLYDGPEIETLKK